MSGRRIKVAIDHRTIMLFLEVACKVNDSPTLDVFPDSEMDASRLLIMLGSIGEFNVVTTTSQVERLFATLKACGVDGENIRRIWASLGNALEVIPDDIIAASKSLETNAALSYELRFLVANAQLARANAVVSPQVAKIASPPTSVMTPTRFFAEVKTRYGFDYAEVRHGDSETR